VSEPTMRELVMAAAERLKNQTYEPCPHVVHPKYSGRRLALTIEETDVVTRCAACFAYIGLTTREGEAG